MDPTWEAVSLSGLAVFFLDPQRALLEAERERQRAVLVESHRATFSLRVGLKHGAPPFRGAADRQWHIGITCHSEIAQTTVLA